MNADYADNKKEKHLRPSAAICGQNDKSAIRNFTRRSFSEGGPQSFLAWVGWQMRVPPEWRPLRIEGEWKRGKMIIGDAEEPVIQLKWWRPQAERFDAARWMQSRLRSLGLRPASNPLPSGPPPGFSETAWVPEAKWAGEEKTLLRLFYGYAPRAGLVLELVVNSEASKRLRNQVLFSVLPSLAVFESGGVTRWSVFGASFESPAGFQMTDKRLLLGDLAFRFRARDRSRLMMRQVYPAELALARRKLEKWIEIRPFREHRKYRPTGPSETWTVKSFGRMLEGTKISGRKSLPAPLGFCAPRQTLTGVLRDTGLDRLLIVEHDSPVEPDQSLVASALSRMNWAQLETIHHGGTENTEKRILDRLRGEQET